VAGQRPGEKRRQNLSRSEGRIGEPVYAFGHPDVPTAASCGTQPFFAGTDAKHADTT
jgi:hypothetical protein